MNFISVRKMEAEVVQMCVNMFNGGPDACGTVSRVLMFVHAILKSLISTYFI